MLDFIKKDPILVISGALALVSCFFVHPDIQYIGYINFRVLAILMSLMLVVAVLVRIGTFDYLTDRLLRRTNSSRKVSLLLVMLSFFMGMLLTNDVTLVTLVPFAIAVLGKFGDRKSLMFSLILMTVSANLGSMLTPIGNPQNLYLYTRYKMELIPFLRLMLPYTALSLILVTLSVFVLCRNKKIDAPKGKLHSAPSASKLVICILLFILCVLAVADVINWILMFALTVAVMILVDRKAFKYIDYALLLTFIFFFVLIGNLGRLPVISDTLSGIVEVSPVMSAVVSSQIISNVPAAMLLSAFTSDGESLVIGTNLGGLGTLIASMASLITYKFYSAMPGDKQKREIGYLPAFTVVNVVFLAILLALHLLMSQAPI